MSLRDRVLEEFNERAAIMEHEGEMSKHKAELEAIVDLATRHGKWVEEFLRKVVDSNKAS